MTSNSVKQQRQAISGTNNSVTNHNNNKSNNITNHIHVHVPDTDKHGKFYTTTKGGSMTQKRLLNFINQVIIKHTDGAPAALFLDAASINRSDATRELCNKNNITVVPIPRNTTAWLQPCDVLVFGPAKNKVRKAMKHALNTDERPSILMSCDELHKAAHEMRSEDIVQCWMNIAHQTIDELKGKSASSSLKRSRSTPIPTQSQHNNN